MAKAKSSTISGRQPGYDGKKVYAAPVKVSQERVEFRAVRCRPGTFEWRYGRRTADAALYHAGSHFAVLWEKAGTAAASSPDLTAEGHGGWKGLPDGRVAAIDDLKPIIEALGLASKLRLIAYCVEGASVTEIANLAGSAPRDMAAVVHHDLIALAKHLHYL